MTHPKDIEGLMADLAQYPQMVGSPTVTCAELNGVEYEQVRVSIPCRKDDADAVAFATEFAVQRLHSGILSAKWRFPEIATIGDSKRAQIYWRLLPEAAVIPLPRVVEYRDDGPDFDHTTDRACVMDHGWVCVVADAVLAWGNPS